MSDVDKLDFRKGGLLRADDLQTLRDAISRPDIDVLGGTGIDARRGPRGSVQLTGVGSLGSIGVANGNITPRSGTTPGTGTVTVKRYDGSALVSGHDVAVLNASSNAMTSGHGIDSGKYVWIGENADGNIWVAPLECS